jgi:hypothetical protein
MARFMPPSVHPAALALMVHELLFPSFITLMEVQVLRMVSKTLRNEIDKLPMIMQHVHTKMALRTSRWIHSFENGCCENFTLETFVRKRSETFFRTRGASVHEWWTKGIPSACAVCLGSANWTCDQVRIPCNSSRKQYVLTYICDNDECWARFPHAPDSMWLLATTATAYLPVKLLQLQRG